MASPIKSPFQIISYIRSNRFLRNVFLVASGSAGAQGLTIALSPLVTRIYGPEVFGVLGTFVAILMFLVPLATMTYPLAIVLPRSDYEAAGLLRLSVYLSFGTTTLITGFFWAKSDWFVETLGIQEVEPYTFILPLSLLFFVWVDIAQQWLIRKNKFSLIARAALVHSFLLNIAKVMLGVWYPFTLVLIGLTTAGYIVHAFLLGFGAYHVFSKCLSCQHISLISVAKKYAAFPLYRAPQVFINAASQSMPIILLTALFELESAGWYTLGRMVMGMPSMLLGKSVSDVLYPDLAEASRKGKNLRKLIVKTTFGLVLVGIIPFSIVIFYGPALFAEVFGEEWRMAGEYARWLAFFFFFNFINKPSVSAVAVLGVERGLFVYEIISTATKAISIFVGYYWFNSDLIAVSLFALTGAFAYIVLICWVILVAEKLNNYAKAG